MVATKALDRGKTSIRKQPQWIQDSFFLGLDYHYRKKNCLAHNALNLSVLGLILGAIGACCGLGTMVPPILYIPVGSLGFGVCFFMLFILVVHEACHDMFMLSKDLKQARTWNRIWGWMVCLPFGVDYINHWEIGHELHHLYLTEPKDPQNCPETMYTGLPLWQHVAKALLLPGYVHIYRRHDDCPGTHPYARSWQLFASMVVIWTTIVSLATIYLGWPVAVAAFLGAEVLSVLTQFKIAMEHAGEIAGRENPFLRSVSSFFPLRQLLMPLNISVHFEHHLNCYVPWYDLMKYHRQLEKIVPPEVQKQIFRYNRDVWQQIQSR